MVYDLLTYPDDRINLVSADVRVFNQEIIEIIEHMKDTMEAHNADGLAAIQIGFALSIVVIKRENGEYLEIINPRILNKKGKVASVESTLYLPDTTRTINRYESISMIYQDREGNQCSLKADGELSLLIQRKFDYVFGGSFVTKLNEKERKKLEKELAASGIVGSFDSDGPISKREYFKSVMTKLLILEFLTLFAPLFDFEKESIDSLFSFDIYATIALILLNIGYFAYAKYEAKKVISCTGCQVINFLSISIKYFLATVAVFVMSYIILGS
jgi:peptide deformylase